MNILIVKRELWESIPLLHVYNETMNEQTPVVVFFHGFMSAKEHNLHYAYQLVQKGVRVILPDALFHGERFVKLSELEMNVSFWKIVLNSVKELHTIYEQLKQKQLLASGKLGVAGTSMGGVVTTGSLAVYPWIQAAGVCMGTTSYTKFAQHQVKEFAERGIQLPMTLEEQQQLMQMLSPYNLDEKEHAWQQCPIIFWHGQRDTVVPYEMTRNFYEQHVHNNGALPIEYISEPKAGHAVSRDGMIKVTAFLAQHLA